MDNTALFRAIGTMRQHLLAEHGDLDPTPKTTLDRMAKLFGTGQHRDWDRDIRVAMFGADDSLGSALARLANTPRTLKLVLRHTDGLWQKLHGEICFDDLLVSTILRFTAGDAFDFLLRRFEILRIAASDASSESNRAKAASEKQRQVIEADWNETTKKSGEWDATAAKTLILFLFPKSAKYFGEEHHIDDRVVPQGVQHSQPTDYWNRMLAGELAPDELHDQTVLRGMGEWSKSPSNSTFASDLCSSSRFLQIWEHFTTGLPVPNVLDLAGQVLDVLRRRDGADASGGKEANVVIALWRLANRKAPKNDSSRDWLIEQIGRSMPTGLRLVNDLYYYWGSTQYGVIANQQDRNLVRETIVAQAKRVFAVDKPDVLVQSLSPGYPYSVRQLVMPVDQKEPPSILTRPSDWRWLSPILLAAATRAPMRVIPEVMFLLTDNDLDPSSGINTYHWNRELLDGMFGADVSRLMEILTADFPMTPIPSDPTAHIVVQNARELARHWRK